MSSEPPPPPDSDSESDDDKYDFDLQEARLEAVKVYLKGTMKVIKELHAYEVKMGEWKAIGEVAELRCAVERAQDLADRCLEDPALKPRKITLGGIPLPSPDEPPPRED